MNIGEWVRHICSIFQCERYEVEFHIIKIRYDIQSLRNNFPKLRGIDIKCFKLEPNEIDIQCAQNIMRAFLPDVKYVILQGVSLRDIQHIGMANLEELMINPVRNPKFDDFLTLNVERCTFHTDRFSLRDLNRLFKLWKKGTFPKLKEFTVLGETNADLNVLLKGLQAKGAEGEAEYTIKNCYGIRAKITVYNNIPASVFVSFTVSK
ncbi:hypothetical protein B9Z55_011261 [Caenorhabditis nigoni]|uniref:Sdz-33 F-box domain-containing protein n=1 Tax=Caenorhabditis nigoni TaxID=1611254 RepID=A0A2G5UJA7_9PELO|nr:hypothetical protein B9Z55_011261 [Caenorhabditis nigoni]